MATVVSLTQTKIEELMAGWQGVSLSQDEINAIVAQLWTDVQTNGAVIQNFENVVVPDLLDQTNAGVLALDDLLTNQLPALETDISLNTNALENLNTVDLPLLQDRLLTSELWIIDLNETILPELYTQLDANNTLLTELNTITLPALEGKFPISGEDIEADAITANHILAHTITALEIAADTITANEIAADTITANEIASHTITAAEILADTITANEIAADTITANEIAAHTITATEILADTITANEIATNAITANEIAANAITAAKIQALTITGDKLSVNTIAANKLILSDMTNLAVDGELLDPSASNWTRVAADEIVRVHNVNEFPYLENKNTASATNMWFQNVNRFGISLNDEFQMSMEVSAPASNTQTLTFSPALQVYDRNGNSSLWRVVDTGTVPIAPGADWTAVEGKIIVTDPNLMSAIFSSFVSGITGAAGAQKLRIRRIMLRRRGGGELIIDGSLSALQIDVNTLTADIMNTGLLQAGMTMTGALTIADANMGWSKSQGLWLGNGTVFYGDDRTNQIEGDLVTESLSVKDGFSLGGDADIHGTMELSDGVSTPSGSVALGQTWPRRLSESLSPASNPGSGVDDVSNIWHGLHSYDASTWVVPFNFFGTGFRKLDKDTLAWAGDIPVSQAWAAEYYPLGFAALGSSYYVLGSDGKRNGDHYIYKLSNTGTLVKQAERRITSLAGFFNRRARLFGDGTRIGMLWNNSAGALLLRWYNAALTEQIGSDVALLTNIGARNVGDAYYGPMYSGGPNRLVVSLFDGDSNMIRAWTIGGTASAPTVARSAVDDFPRAQNSTVIGLLYEPGDDRFYHMDRQGYFYMYSRYKDGGTLSAQYTFYDGNVAVYPAGTIVNGVDVSGQVSGPHETPASPLSTFPLAKRAWPTVTAPPAPDELVTDVTKVDKANRLGVYAAINGTPRLQSYLPVGVRTINPNVELNTSSVLANASGVPSFANAMVPSPGYLRSGRRDTSSKPLIEINGDGSGRLGNRNWNSDGLWTPLCRAGISGNAAQGTGASSEVGISLPSLLYNVGCTVSSTAITVGKAGFYRIDVLASWVAAAGGSRIALLKRNGATVQSWTVPHAGATSNVNAQYSHYMTLNAGDSITMAQYQSTTGSLNTHSQSYPRLNVQQIEDL